MLLIRLPHQTTTKHVATAAVCPPAPPVVPGALSLEQNVRALHLAGCSQRAIAREMNIDRRKVKQIIDRAVAAKLTA
jgi:hypothetical protein